MEKVVVKENTCVGCGMCVHQNPEYLIFDDNGHAQAIDKAIEPNDKSNILESVECCPVEAICIIEEK